MKKLKLNLDGLRVDSFATADGARRTGTVRGNEWEEEYEALIRFPGTSQLYTPQNCGSGLTCGSTCGQFTCASCPASCGCV